MPERPNKEISEKAERRVLEKNSIPNFEAFSTETGRILADINHYILNEPQAQCRLRRIQWETDLLNQESHFKELYTVLTSHLEDEAIINRIERQAGWRNLLFRVGTTAAIMLTLGIGYSIGGYFDNVYLPLQQTKVVHYYEGKEHIHTPP